MSGCCTDEITTTEGEAAVIDVLSAGVADWCGGAVPCTVVPCGDVLHKQVDGDEWGPGGREEGGVE